MEALFQKIRENTVAFNLGDEETWRELYEPLYKTPSAGIAVVRDERYGAAERNHLDVFFDKDNQESGKPVLAFLHGGGFFSGDKAWSDKCWGNIGNYFAEHGMVVVLVNHQLVPHVQYPGGADDVQLAREWIYNNISADKFGRGSPDKVILFGHSSGGAHIAANLYAAGDLQRQLKGSALFPPVAGVIYLSVPFWYDRTRPIRQKIIRQYYGSDAEEVWGPVSALGLFQRLPDDSPLLKEAADAQVAFFNAYRERSRPSGTLPFLHVLDKHNHLSNVLSIGTDDTAQGERLLGFILSCIARQNARGKHAVSLPSIS
ncbi:alpha/beta-hydrolase [Thozetella sp. PMI_491]|nr:alpha/beta-hydrolase [Thozetella sp. PMI_491]